MIVMQSMELDDDEKLDTVMPIPMADAPEYPYGLKICLTQAEFEKLGLDPSEAIVGGIVHLHALARVTSYSCNQTEGGEDCRCELQITDMAVESEDEENEAADMASKPLITRAKSLYKSSTY